MFITALEGICNYFLCLNTEILSDILLLINLQYSQPQCIQTQHSQKNSASKQSYHKNTTETNNGLTYVLVESLR